MSTQTGGVFIISDLVVNGWILTTVFPMNDNALLIGGNADTKTYLNLSMANRHGLIAGATGTGKTITLQILAENFAKRGVPVFLADIKGDLSGLAKPAKPHPKISERITHIGIKDYLPQSSATVFWDIFGKQGHQLRTTVSEFGPLLLAAVLDLNDTQTATLYTAFKIADQQGLLLLDLKDLGALLDYMQKQRDELEGDFGSISAASVAAIQRRFLMLEEQGASNFFGEPALQLPDLMRRNIDGKGLINILDATTLINSPRLYSIFLLWLISELFEELPERGDADAPRLVFFFDEAHLLFNNAPKILIEKIEQVVRLIRSKGVGIYFVSQSPADIPDSVLGQLGNRVQHALRAYTPKDQKAVRIAAQSFRANPRFETADVISELGVGEALVSFLDLKGVPGAVERVLVCPPESMIGPISASERTELITASDLSSQYDKNVDRESAYEILAKRSQQRVEPAPAKTVPAAPARAPRRSQGTIEAFAKSAARAMGSSLGRQIIRGVLGSILGKR
jgi:DNA helicase HerA-like ATPase